MDPVPAPATPARRLLTRAQVRERASWLLLGILVVYGIGLLSELLCYVV